MEHTEIIMTGIFSNVPSISTLIDMEYWSTKLSSYILEVQGIFNDTTWHQYYNISVSVLVLMCQEPSFLQKPPQKEDFEKKQEESHGFFQEILAFFRPSTSQSDSVLPEPSPVDQNCENFFSTSTQISQSFFAWMLFMIIFGLLFVVGCYWLCFRCVRKDAASKTSKIENLNLLHRVDDEGITIKKNVECNETVSKGKKINNIDERFTKLLYLKNKVDHAKLKPVNGEACFDELFQHTVMRHLKDLDSSLGVALCMPGIALGTSSLPSSSSYVSSLTSPRLARKNISNNHRHTSRSPSLGGSQGSAGNEPMDENAGKSWLVYKQFQSKLFWEFPFSNLDTINISHFSKGNEDLFAVLQFLHQNGPIKSHQWEIAVSVVNYTLFLLEHQMRYLCKVNDDFIQVKEFRSSGSASNGTLIKSADRFDLLLLIDMPSCSELMVLHNNFCDEVPPGYLILGAKEQNINLRQSCQYVRKASIKGISAFFLQREKVVERVASLLKKSILQLNTTHKSKLDLLPYSFQVSQTKSLVITLDTRLLRGFGLGLEQINIKITPALNLPISDYCLMPPLFAVPSDKEPARNSTGSSLSKGALSKLFSSPTVSDLHWILHTECVQVVMLEDIETRFKLAGVQSYHRECLMILKALFGPGNDNRLLSKGEVDSYILQTVVCFLLQESPAHAWSLDHLADRVSDAVHFLRSAYEAVWLPEVTVHNPHLAVLMPALGHVMGHVMQGHQRNLLAHESDQGALNTLEHITQRLQETRLGKCVKDHFSPELWEYEFFMFG